MGKLQFSLSSANSNELLTSREIPTRKIEKLNFAICSVCVALAIEAVPLVQLQVGLLLVDNLGMRFHFDFVEIEEEEENV